MITRSDPLASWKFELRWKRGPLGPRIGQLYNRALAPARLSARGPVRTIITSWTSRLSIAALFVLGLSPFAQAQSRWLKLAPLPKMSEELSFATANGKIYVFGGLPEGKNPPPGL